LFFLNQTTRAFSLAGPGLRFYLIQKSGNALSGVRFLASEALEMIEKTCQRFNLDVFWITFSNPVANLMQPE
jgi:hypothetical protein